MKIKIPIGILKEAQSSQVKRKLSQVKRTKEEEEEEEEEEKRRRRKKEEEKHEEEEEEEEEEKEFKRVSIFRFALKLKIVNRLYFFFGIPYKIDIISSLCLCLICQEC
uniref:Uncharacterized protein n=1 Tax=Strongyloides stercoralis TaxID=6248 RepID=A0AAF5CYR0_STRER